MAEVDTVFDVGRSAASSRDDAAEDLLVFVDRLAAAAVDDPAVQAAHRRIGQAVRGGSPPPGLRRLAEALASSSGEPPAPRRPVDDPASIVPALHATALATLERVGTRAVAAVVDALVDDGRRVIVAADTDEELDALGAAVGTGALVDRLPTLSAADLRQLRRLCATSTEMSRSRPAQQIPAPDELPDPVEVRARCTEAEGPPVSGVAALIPDLLDAVDVQRRTALTAVARRAVDALAGLGDPADGPWMWELLGALIHTRHRAVVDRLVQEVTQALSNTRQLASAPRFEVLEPLPTDSVAVLRAWQDHLVAGGRPRSLLPSPAQRAAQPVLRLLRLGGRVPETAADVRDVLDHLVHHERMRNIAAACAQIAVPAPDGPTGLGPLADALDRVGAAARAVAALRHDVLFLATDSPVAVPDVATAGEVAAAVLDHAQHGSPAAAKAWLAAASASVAGLDRGDSVAPEHADAVLALRDHDADAYAAAVDALGAARRQRHDEESRLALLRVLRGDSPALADAWAETGTGGLVLLARTVDLLTALPDPDSVDVVVVLGAQRLGVERLLLAAVAPRMVAVTDDARPTAARSTDARSVDEGAPTVLTVLQRAGALVVGTPAPSSGGKVVPITKAVRAVEVA